MLVKFNSSLFFWASEFSNKTKNKNDEKPADVSEIHFDKCIKYFRTTLLRISDVSDPFRDPSSVQIIKTGRSLYRKTKDKQNSSI